MDEGTVVETTPGGAKRGSVVDEVPRHTLSQIALRRYANAMAEGAVKYGAGNWRKGLPAANLLDHLYEHLAAFLEGNADEDHLGHALWNLATLVHFSETRPDLFESLPLEVDVLHNNSEDHEEATTSFRNNVRREQLITMKEKATAYVRENNKRNATQATPDRTGGYGEQPASDDQRAGAGH